ncbi:two pore domain potassium channel family protein [Candidatus Woesearchaeota archaeon]|jgi:hypothetical protein|nr:two pore domain potassium channel family protein [Candidatus Woesearchaeota archaeon]MBT4114196.1 two pore domain potassium channel family protein [Candidatus Woesearchaeota archaeon]MBT4248264.1 two pore domain potassium channel family protein [Candidatus Woesearchaeota archaeon]
MHPNDKIITAFFLLFLLLLTGTFAYHNLEGWNYVDSVYFTAMTITTVGYGDLVPSTDISKLFTVAFSFAGISIALVILVSIGGEYYNKERRLMRYRIQQYMNNRDIRVKERLKKQRKRLRSRKTSISKRDNVFSLFNR